MTRRCLPRVLALVTLTIVGCADSRAPSRGPSDSPPDASRAGNDAGGPTECRSAPFWCAWERRCCTEVALAGRNADGCYRCGSGRVPAEQCVPEAGCEMTECSRHSDCVLELDDCCGSHACEHMPTDSVGIHRADASRWRSQVCPSGDLCCDPAAMRSQYMVPLCVAGRCTSDGRSGVGSFSRCAEDEQCVLRYIDCCPCDPTDEASPWIGIRADAIDIYDSVVCEGVSCGVGCSAEPPPELRATCNGAYCMARFR